MRSEHELAVAGTILWIIDGSGRDGPISFLVKGHDGRQVKFYFPSLFTVPGPSDTDVALQRKVVGTQAGDEVLAEGDWLDERRVRLKSFQNYTRPSAAGPAQQPTAGALPTGTQ